MGKPKVWHPEDIKAAIRKTGITLTTLGQSRGLGGSTCRVALTRPCPAGEIVIAEYLGVAPKELWPDRYHADGTPRHPRASRGLYRAKAFRNEGSKGEAA